MVIYACLDLAYLLRILSQFCNNFGPVYIELVKYGLQYISEILDLGLKFDREANTPDYVIGYINSNFARLKTDQKLIENYDFMLVRAVISYLSKL